MRTKVKMIMDFWSMMLEAFLFQLFVTFIFGVIAKELSFGKLGVCCLLDENAPSCLPGACRGTDICSLSNMLYKLYVVGYENKSWGAFIFDYFIYIYFSNLLIIHEQGLTNIMDLVIKVDFFANFIALLKKRSEDKMKKRLPRSLSDTRRKRFTGQC